MKITTLDLWAVELTSHQPYHMASGKTCATVTTHVLRVRTQCGLEGWGEVCPIPHYLPAFAGGVASALTEFSPLLIGHDPSGVDATMRALDRHLPGHEYVKSMVDMALWDVFARSLKVPLYTLLGGRTCHDMPVYQSITCIEPDDMARIARDAFASGVRQFQVKLGVEQDAAIDAERLIKVRDAVGDGPVVYGDWNCGATRLQAIRTARAVAGLDVMLEQPCPTLEDCAAVKQATGLAMKIDEGSHDLLTLLRAASLGCLDAVALKLSKFGGLSAMRRARDLTVHLGAEICAECTWGSDIVTTAALHFAASTPAQSLLNTCDLSGYVAPSICDDAPRRATGRLAPPEGHGLGVTPNLDRLGAPLLQLA